MKRQNHTGIRPPARRHQTYRILSRRRRPVFSSHSPIKKTEAEKKTVFPYPYARYRWLVHHHKPGFTRKLTPSLRTRRRRMHVLLHSVKSTPDAFSDFENMLDDVKTSIEHFSPKETIIKEESTQILPSVSTDTETVTTVSETKRHHNYADKTVIFLIILLLAFLIAGFSLHQGKEKPAYENQSADQSVEKKQPPESAVPSSTPLPSPSPLAEQLEPEIESTLSSLQGEWSCYVKDLHTGETITYNSHKGHSASLIKLFTAGAYEQAVLDGSIQRTASADQNEALMISQSDNDAWVSLETAIGQGSYTRGHQLVQQFARSHGFSDTGRLVDENDNPDMDGGMNWTSVTDVGNCLDEIYSGTYVSKEASDRILDLMKQQVHVNKIPAGLPEGTICANKTGELDLTQNDAAIVYGPKTNYILVVMSDGMYNGEEAVGQIVSLSSMVYQFLEN